LVGEYFHFYNCYVSLGAYASIAAMDSTYNLDKWPHSTPLTQC
jgi:hypothetical protein